MSNYLAESDNSDEFQTSQLHSNRMLIKDSNRSANSKPNPINDHLTYTNLANIKKKSVN